MVSNIGTVFNLSDNSGIKKLKNINILNKNKKVKIDNTSVSVIKKGKNFKSKIKKSDIVNALIVSTKCSNFNRNNSTKFNKNSTIILKNNTIHFNKIKGLISYIIKNRIYKSKVNLKKAKFV